MLEKTGIISEKFYLRFNIELAPIAPNANKPKTEAGSGVEAGLTGVGLKVKSSIPMFPNWLISNRVIPGPDMDKVCAVKAVKVSEATRLSNSSKPKRVTVSISGPPGLASRLSPAKTETKSTASVKKPLISPARGAVPAAELIPD
ncbi:hypothetical protein [Okeania sp. SIO1I7]|uniref:hypothetical protein n=1 Tax=Okeania sp. SIO1I7 TaxID=2607772 RepID=UPI0025F1523B|nr:hypothetical protein [Okeania sp. SIO1I7]